MRLRNELAFAVAGLLLLVACFAAYPETAKPDAAKPDAVQDQANPEPADSGGAVDPDASSPFVERPQGAPREDSLVLATEKLNAYVGFMNRTLRALDSLARYKSWVNMKTGPTGRERLVYGAYDVYDTRREKTEAEARLDAPPKLPEVDDAMRAYIAANDALGPVLNETTGYYERGDYQADHFEHGKELHKQIVTLGAAFVDARARLEAGMRKEKLALDTRRLDELEKREGRHARWHADNVMMHGRAVMDALNTTGGDTVDVPAFDAAMKDLSAAVAGMDAYRNEHPDAFSGFGSFPDGFVGRLRNVQGRLARTKGNLRRAAGFDLTFITSDWNSMVTMSELPRQFDGK